MDPNAFVRLAKEKVGGYVAVEDGIIQRVHDPRPNQSLILNDLATLDRLGAQGLRLSPQKGQNLAHNGGVLADDIARERAHDLGAIYENHDDVTQSRQLKSNTLIGQKMAELTHASEPSDPEHKPVLNPIHPRQRRASVAVQRNRLKSQQFV